MSRYLRTAVALAGCLSAFCAMADEPAQYQLFNTLAHCQGSREQIAEFNRLVDAGQLSFSRDEAHGPWGGGAWQLGEALRIGVVSSKTAVMTDRFSFFILVASASPHADMQKAAKALKLEKKHDSDGYVAYQRDLDSAGVNTLQVVSTEDAKRNFYVGCSYSPPSAS
ncbi:hypothetical protein EXN22_22015 [Pseudomonas tructae]|uniref:Uncharacterized protein n=1 Tax=Pseudomonas tructae TaxID=2518644 RepID=A0A411MN56_9PSED|nr:hypothetical protein [Pseudomonas tructae]QBF28231.1 hypothetical protein EXN22_22015 [Pseudomonas tructae]